MPHTFRRECWAQLASMLAVRGIAALCLILLLASPAFAQVISRPIIAPTYSVGSVLVRFHSAGQTDPAGKGIAVVDAGGKPVPFRVLAHDPEGQTILAVERRDDGGQLSLQYTPKPSGPASPRADDRVMVSLLLQVYAVDRASFKGLADAPTVIAAAHPQGSALVGTVGLAANPFGETGDFLAVFEGVLDVDKDETVKLFAVHSGGAQVEIDGKTVISQAEPSMHHKSEELAGKAVGVHLSAGQHKLRFIHAHRGERVLAVLGKMSGERARPLESHEFLHQEFATLGPATPADARPAVGFDVAQLDQIADDAHLFTRVSLTPIAPPPAGMGYRWDFGDGVALSPPARAKASAGEGQPQPSAPEEIQHVFVGPATSWKVALELVEPGRGQPVARAGATVRAAQLEDTKSAGDAELLGSYSAAIARSDYSKATAETMASLYALLSTAEQPALVAPLAEQFVKRFGDRGGPTLWAMKNDLAIFLSRDQPERAVKLFGELSRSSADSWKGACAAANQIDLLVFRLGKTSVSDELGAVFQGRVPRERALLKARMGDVFLAAGKLDKAADAYREAQQDSSRAMEPQKVAILQGAYRETALAYLEQKRWPDLRDLLFQWEADFPMAKLSADLPLITGRYYQSIGDDPRAAIEFKNLMELNPLHPSRPEIAYRLAQSLARTGKGDEARKWFGVVAKEYPNSPFAQDAEWQAKGGGVP
ncbi:MAG: hypothetical protein NTW19_02375 [Planctomycetota bacterium]|nr:hypothetical protein [Planctomycetota bacterium]